ncbi:MAG: hypothetical protein KY466_00170 [Gemmatimonadetes bacterium]|nr:hypothetical protein [Gemmatimonadota bacterium]
MRTVVGAAILAVAAIGCGGSAAPSPYAGEESRAIKALDEAEVSGLLAGEGMGFALAAELNGLPGPRHVLDAAEALELDSDQRVRVQAIFEAMNTEAVRLGSAIVEGERELDRLFGSGAATRTDVAERTVALGTLRGRLRNAHLQAHLQTAPLLTEHQRMRYRDVRGYGTRSADGAAAQAEHSGHPGH